MTYRGKYFDTLMASIREHAKTVSQGVSKLLELVSSIPSRDPVLISKLYAELNSIEEHGDELKRSIMNELRVSYIHPDDRENLLRFTLSLDDALGFAKSAGKRVLMVIEAGVPIEGEIYGSMREIAEKSLYATSKIMELLEVMDKDPKKAIELTHEIEEIEERIDELRLEAIGRIYAECSREVKPGCIMFPPIIDDLEGISDVCENIADIYRLFTISR